MLSKRVKEISLSALRHAWGLFYPPTKAKWHRALHVAGTAMTMGFILSTWLLSELPAKTKASTTLVVAVAYLTQGRKAVARVDSLVDELPIPDGAAATNVSDTGPTEVRRPPITP